VPSKKKKKTTTKKKKKKKVIILKLTKVLFKSLFKIMAGLSHILTETLQVQW
jgi:hypothetical protein